MLDRFKFCVQEEGIVALAGRARSWGRCWISQVGKSILAACVASRLMLLISRYGGWACLVCSLQITWSDPRTNP